MTMISKIPQPRGQRAIMLGLAAAAVLGVSCSLALDASERQCETSADCAGLGPEFAGTVCGDDHTCTKNALVSCDTNAACIDAFGGAPYRCRQSDHKCISLLSTECNKIRGDAEELRNDKTIYLGYVTCSSGSETTVNTCKAWGQALDMARDEFKRNVGGIPSAQGVRPVVFVECDQTTAIGGEAAKTAMTHLIKNVEPPVVIGPTYSQDAVNLAQQTIPANINFLLNIAQTSAVTALPATSTIDPLGQRLIWRTAPVDQQGADAIAKSITQYWEPTLKAPGGIVPPGQPLKVMVVVRGDAFGKSYTGILTDRVVFNGKSGAANALDGNYKVHDWGTFTDPNAPEAQPAFQATVQDAVDFKAHLYIYVDGPEAPGKVMVPMETTWTESTFRPRHLIPATSQGTVLAAVGTNADLAKRAFAYASKPVANPVFDKYVFNYNVSFPNGPPASSTYQPHTYDAVYVAYFSLAAVVDTGPLNGPRAALGMAKLVPGPNRPLIQAGNVGDISKGFTAVAKDGIDLDGASGPLDFDLKTGNTPTDVEMQCVYMDGTGKAAGFNSTGFAYLAAKNEYTSSNVDLNCKPK